VGKLGAVIWNTYREAVRARILHGLFGLAFASTVYAIIVGQYASKHAARVLSDLGVAFLSTFGVVVAIVLGATSLYREIDLKTIYPILARPISRGQYLVGKFFGALFTLLVFMAGNAGLLLWCLGGLHGGNGTLVLIAFGVGAAGIATLGWKVPAARTYLPALASVYMLVTGYLASSQVVDERHLVMMSCALSVGEVCIVIALALFFSAFSSPFLTALFTAGVFVVGRSADTLGHLPKRVFGPVIHTLGVGMSWTMPNLMVYVPPRTVLTGESIDVVAIEYLAFAVGQAAAWSVGLLAIASYVFRRRDFV
jgi:Cu-processing system permease protein